MSVRTHGEAANRQHPRGTGEYRIWGGMVNRCTNRRNRAYLNYGARGIGVCTRWLKFENFLADMGRRPSLGHSIDRIDVNGPYAPSNCRWATDVEQSRNRRNIKPIKINGVSRTLAEWSLVSGVQLTRIWERIYRRGWSPADAVFTPVTAQTHCKNGHPLAGDNVRMEGCSRRCRACKKAYDHHYRMVDRGIVPPDFGAADEGAE